MASQPYTNLNTGAESGNAMASLLGLVNTAKDKWNSSGANEAVAQATASIPESTKSYVGTIFKREHLRSITVFFGLGEERPFYVEKNPSLFMERLRHNVSFFYLNYFFLTAVLFCLTLFVTPTAIVGILLLAAAWMWVIRASAEGYLPVGSIRIPQKTATVLMAGISVLVLIYLLSNVFWLTLFWSGFLAAIHAVLRDASMHKDMEDAVAMEGDLVLGGEDNFLNAARVDMV